MKRFEPHTVQLLGARDFSFGARGQSTATTDHVAGSEIAKGATKTATIGVSGGIPLA